MLFIVKNAFLRYKGVLVIRYMIAFVKTRY